MFNVWQSFMLRNFFGFKKQCELSCPKLAQNVLGLLRNAHQTRKIKSGIGFEVSFKGHGHAI